MQLDRVLKPLTVCLLIGAGLWWWSSRDDYVPEQPHDLFGVGYEDSNLKPEELRVAEEIVFNHWHYVAPAIPRREERIRVLSEELRENAERMQWSYLNEAERLKYAEIWWVFSRFDHALGRYDLENGTSLRESMREPIGQFFEDYRKDVLGIRVYRHKVPEDREILQAHGIHVDWPTDE